MRMINNHLSAATAAASTPFQGLGFAVDEVLAAAQTMTLVPHCHGGSSGVSVSVPEPVVQPGGYKLLVALGREIRGR
ncbi:MULTISPECIES: hypothetical protein [unclassified Pseudodesulfovibrio]|uniref:hypothetical protein n=1 Tax=unclassified Pseudodesulfovibrio TaxID=2661612 RepID=UPI000FEC2066|nr:MULTISPECIES: hypothetical protein [unclassified Pseudodesulfovibrio]MCJ2164535.1 hypothetical protein [Pseudodesulfovibrio sp. S3-i]RWU04733.1 hypothetical protein DWB63_08260 [Pseudodesulfovibrio sp. S3]